MKPKNVGEAMINDYPAMRRFAAAHRVARKRAGMARCRCIFATVTAEKYCLYALL